MIENILFSPSWKHLDAKSCQKYEHNHKMDNLTYTSHTTSIWKFLRNAQNSCKGWVSLYTVTAPYFGIICSQSFDFLISFFRMNDICVWYHISSQNFHRMCVWLMYTFWYVNKSNMIVDYGRFSDSIAFLRILIYYNMFEKL